MSTTAPGRDCALCPRLAEYRAANRAKEPGWHNAPVPSWGPREAPLLVLGLAPGRALLRRFALPKPGEGPGPAAREAGRYEILASGAGADGRRHGLRVIGRRDPGYGATSRVIVACARTLLAQAAGPGGLLTPGAANLLGGTLIQNTLNDQLIKNQTSINATVNTAGMLRALNFGTSLNNALSTAVAPR